MAILTRDVLVSEGADQSLAAVSMSMACYFVFWLLRYNAGQSWNRCCDGVARRTSWQMQSSEENIQHVPEIPP